MRSIIKNKKAFLTRDFIFAAALFSTIYALFSLGITGVADQYDDTSLINADISNNYNRLQETSDSMDIALASVRSGEGLGFRGAFDVAFAATFTVFQLVLGTLGLYGDVMASFASDFGLDRQVVNILFTLGFIGITITIVFVWLSSISRGKI